MKYTQCLCLCSLIGVLSGLSSSHGSMVNSKLLHVGVELFKETLPLQNGARLYQLQELQPHTWYKVKISYPASIPSSFSLQLKRGDSEVGPHRGRKLLNTEKLVFRTDGIHSLTYQGGLAVLVNVEPEGVVAIPGKKDTEYVMFNIVCDELLLGIPHKARCVVAVLVGAILLVSSGLTLAGTILILVITAPFFILFSPILVLALALKCVIFVGFVFSICFLVAAVLVKSCWCKHGSGTPAVGGPPAEIMPESHQCEGERAIGEIDH